MEKEVYFLNYTFVTVCFPKYSPAKNRKILLKVEKNNCNLILDDSSNDKEVKEFLKEIKVKYPNCV